MTPLLVATCVGLEPLSPLRAGEVGQLKPPSPLLAQAEPQLKPPSPLLAQAEPQLKPPSPLRACMGLFWAVGAVHWCCGFHAGLYSSHHLEVFPVHSNMLPGNSKMAWGMHQSGRRLVQFPFFARMATRTWATTSSMTRRSDHRIRMTVHPARSRLRCRRCSASILS